MFFEYTNVQLSIRSKLKFDSGNGCSGVQALGASARAWEAEHKLAGEEIRNERTDS
jgi:hypothetical protein